MTSPNKHGIFQMISNDYNIEFKDDIGKNRLSEEQYKKQINDTLIFSLNKMKYLTTLSRFKKINLDKDYILKFWLWSYH